MKFKEFFESIRTFEHREGAVFVIDGDLIFWSSGIALAMRLDQTTFDDLENENENEDDDEDEENSTEESEDLEDSDAAPDASEPEIEVGQVWEHVKSAGLWTVQAIGQKFVRLRSDDEDYSRYQYQDELRREFRLVDIVPASNVEPAATPSTSSTTASTTTSTPTPRVGEIWKHKTAKLIYKVMKVKGEGVTTYNLCDGCESVHNMPVFLKYYELVE